MLLQAVFIVFAVGFISVMSGLEVEQSAAYKAAFKCFKAGHDADAHHLEEDGISATRKEMIESSCEFGKVSFEFMRLAIREGAKENGVYNNKIEIHKIPRLSKPSRNYQKKLVNPCLDQSFFYFWGWGSGKSSPPPPPEFCMYESYDSDTWRIGIRVEALLTDTLVSGQLYLRPPSQNFV